MIPRETNELITKIKFAAPVVDIASVLLVYAFVAALSGDVITKVEIFIKTEHARKEQQEFNLLPSLIVACLQLFRSGSKDALHL